MSVKTRVMPTGQYLQDNFDKHLSAFFRRNAMKFHVSLEDFLDESNKWTQEYQDFSYFDLSKWDTQANSDTSI